MIKKIALSFSLPSILLWYLGIKKKVDTSSRKRVVIPQNLTEGISFVDDAIILKEKNIITAFSAKCTHLGCKINRIENGKLVCPCHGSKFDFKGFPKSGPANKPLKKITIETDKLSDELVIYV